MNDSLEIREPEPFGDLDVATRVVHQLSEMWTSRARGEVVACGDCAAAHVALVIGERTYRWACVDCGWKSAWFRPFGGGVRVVGGSVVQS